MNNVEAAAKVIREYRATNGKTATINTVRKTVPTLSAFQYSTAKKEAANPAA